MFGDPWADESLPPETVAAFGLALLREDDPDVLRVGIVFMVTMLSKGNLPFQLSEAHVHQLTGLNRHRTAHCFQALEETLLIKRAIHEGRKTGGPRGGAYWRPGTAVTEPQPNEPSEACLKAPQKNSDRPTEVSEESLLWVLCRGPTQLLRPEDAQTSSGRCFFSAATSLAGDAVAGRMCCANPSIAQTEPFWKSRCTKSGVDLYNEILSQARSARTWENRCPDCQRGDTKQTLA